MQFNFEHIEDKTYIIEKDGKHGIFCEEHGILLPPEYDSIEYHPRSKWYILQKSKRYGVFKKDSGMLLDVEYNDILRISAKTAYIINKNGKCGLISENGRIVSPLIWDSISRGDTGQPDYLTMTIGKYISAMTPDGKLIIQPFLGEVLFGLIKRIIIFRKDERDKKIFVFKDIYTKETIFEGEFDSVEKLEDSYVKIHKADTNFIFDVKERKVIQ